MFLLMSCTTSTFAGSWRTTPPHSKCSMGFSIFPAHRALREYGVGLTGPPWFTVKNLG